MQSTTYVPEEKEYVANCMKYTFHLKGVFAIPEISQLFWHGICSALEYGQEIARYIYHYRYQQHPHVSSAAVNPHLPGGGFFVGCGLGCECSPAALGPRTRSPKTRAPTPAKIKGIIGLFIT